MKNLLLLPVFFLLISCSAQEQPVFTSFTKPAENPILKADSTFVFICPVKKELVRWQKADVFNPGAIVKDNKVYLLYRCEDNSAAALGGRTSRIGLAESKDGIHFIKHPTPILYPDSGEFMQYDYPGGCEDPRVVVTEDSTYILTYTSWNQKTASLSIAFSKDLVNWTKKGTAFAKANNGKFMKDWTKSGSIITKFQGDKQVVAKIKGKYWMYWGEHFINLAWSENLIDWNPILNEKGELKVIAGPRKNKFDSKLSECGPPALITKEGIVLLYNGKNAEGIESDSKFAPGTYCVGKLVFDINDPERIIYRSENPVLYPTLKHEISGQYKSGTTFAEGLVFFQNRWILYYGTADSFVGVAIQE